MLSRMKVPKLKERQPTKQEIKMKNFVKTQEQLKVIAEEKRLKNS